MQGGALVRVEPYRVTCVNCIVTPGAGDGDQQPLSSPRCIPFYHMWAVRTHLNPVLGCTAHHEVSVGLVAYGNLLIIDHCFKFLSDNSSGRVKVMTGRHALLLDIGMFHCSCPSLGRF